MTRAVGRVPHDGFQGWCRNSSGPYQNSIALDYVSVLTQPLTDPVRRRPVHRQRTGGSSAMRRGRGSRICRGRRSLVVERVQHINLIKGRFNKLKNWRRITTRYDKTPNSSASSLSLQLDCGRPSFTTLSTNRAKKCRNPLQNWKFWQIGSALINNSLIRLLMLLF